MTWSIEGYSDTVAKLRVVCDYNKQWEFKILVTSDRHIDSVHSDVKMQKKHLDQAKEGGWPVIDIGDIYDAMQGRKDPRASRLGVLACLNEKGEYFDELVNYGYDFFNPYEKVMALMGLGNHETAIMTHNETNLLGRLVNRMSGPVLGAYSGWVKVMFEGHGSQRRKTVNIHYTHGSGGSAPVTKGVIGASRKALWLPDADILISGHTHETWYFPITRERLSDVGVAYMDEQLHLQIPSYKNETINVGRGFAVERCGGAPKPVGAYWLKFWFDRSDNKIKWDAERAR